MGVAPHALRAAVHIAVGDVHAAQKPDHPVDHHDLAVVAVVDLAGEQREPDMQESIDLDAGGAHVVEKRLPDPHAPHVVVEHPHLDPLAGLGHERIAQAAARPVVAEDVVLDMDVMPGRGDGFEQRLHLRSAVDIGRDPAAVERHGEGGLPQQPGERQMALRERRSTGGIDLFELRGDPLAHAPRNDPLLGEVLPEKEIDDQSDARRQNQQQNPRQRLERIAVIGDDDQQDARDRQRVDD